MRRFDFEFPMAQAVADYLTGLLDDTITGFCPIVTFFDPMSIQEANRIVCMVPSGDTMVESPGNAKLTVEVGIKTQWSQKTMGQDFKDHYCRVNEVRDRLMSATLADDLDALIEEGIAIDFVQPRREFHSRIVEGWIYSETSFQVDCFSTDLVQPVV